MKKDKGENLRNSKNWSNASQWKRDSGSPKGVDWKSTWNWYNHQVYFPLEPAYSLHSLSTSAKSHGKQSVWISNASSKVSVLMMTKQGGWRKKNACFMVNYHESALSWTLQVPLQKELNCKQLSNEENKERERDSLKETSILPQPLSNFIAPWRLNSQRKTCVPVNDKEGKKKAQVSSWPLTPIMNPSLPENQPTQGSDEKECSQLLEPGCKWQDSKYTKISDYSTWANKGTIPDKYQAVMLFQHAP